MRPIDMVLALPAMLLAVALIAIIGPGSNIATLAIAVIYMPILARVVRSSTLVVVSQTYIESARARGTGRGRSSRATCCPTRSVPRSCRRRS